MHQDKGIVNPILWEEVEGIDLGAVLVHRPLFLPEHIERGQLQRPSRYSSDILGNGRVWACESILRKREAPTHVKTGPDPRCWCLAHKESGLRFLIVSGSLTAAVALAKQIDARFALQRSKYDLVKDLDFKDFCKRPQVESHRVMPNLPQDLGLVFLDKIAYKYETIRSYDARVQTAEVLA